MDADVGVTTRVAWRDELGRYASAVEAGAEATVVQASDKGAFLAAVLAPKRTLALAGSIEPFISGSGQGGWRAGTDHALVQEKGGRAHEIRKRIPDNPEGGTLANPAQGFFSKRAVRHPGNPGVHFMRRALAMVAAELPMMLRKNIP